MADVRVFDPLRDTIRPGNYLPILKAWRERPTLWADLMRVPQLPAVATSFSGRVLVANALKPFLPLLASIDRRSAAGAPPLAHPNPTGLPGDEYRAWLDDAVAASLDVRAHRPFFNELRARTGWKGLVPDARLFEELVSCVAEALPHVRPRGMIAILEAELFGDEVRMPAVERVFHGANIVKFFAAAARANPDEEYDVDVDVGAPYSMEIAVYCVTGGDDCETRARAAGEKKEAFRCLVLDAIGSSVADTIALDLTILVERERMLRGAEGSVARKLSVGYGDWPLEEQRTIFEILEPPKRIGVELNDACLMIPEKSVSGLIGMKRKS